MVDVVILLKGIFIGFSIAAPVGPIGILCIKLSLAEGRTYGLAAGLGAATADAIYGSIAGFSLTAISSLLLGYRGFMGIAGGIFLCYLGIRTLLASPAERPAKAGGKSIVETYVSTFFLTLVNPMTILSFTAVFAGLGIGGRGEGIIPAAILVLGVFFGSSLWWITLSGFVGYFREAIKPRWLKLVNIISGVILLSFGIVSLGGVFWPVR